MGQVRSGQDARVSDEIDVATVLADPAGVMEKLRSDERELSAALEATRTRIEIAGRLVEAAEAWSALQGKATSAVSRSGTDDPGPAAGSRSPAEASYAEAVAGLLEQDPGRVWRVVDLAAVLGIEKVDSLRTTMSTMARTGCVVKVAPAQYRAVTAKADAPSSASSSSSSSSSVSAAS
jgi:hypothetical protein